MFLCNIHAVVHFERVPDWFKVINKSWNQSGLVMLSFPNIHLFLVNTVKNIRELSWMSHGVMRFWFLLNFLFISVAFDILASLSVSGVFSSGFSGRWKSFFLDILKTIAKFVTSIKFNVPGTFLSNYKSFSGQSSCLLLLLEVRKNHYKKENIGVGGSMRRRDALFWIHSRETWLKLFGLLLVAMGFSIFMFLIGIKILIRHPVVLFDNLILLEQ